MENKTCKVCNEEKSLLDFYAHPNTKDGHFDVCKTCYSERENLKNRLKLGFESLKPNFCECCGKESKLQLDHCHQTKLFRGFVCRSCNQKLGHYGDNFESALERGAEDIYLDYLKLASLRRGDLC